MRDYLQDLIQHTHGLGVVDLVKITASATETKIDAIAEDRSVVITGAFNQPIKEFDGVFGMPNLTKLRTIIGFEDYTKDAVITVVTETRNQETVPTTIHFETKNKDFINDYRLMSKELVEAKVRNLSLVNTTWNVTVKPTLANIQRLKRQAAAHNEESMFSTKVENNELKVYFGDPSTHSGNFVFHSGVSGSLSKSCHWPVKVFLSIMDLPGEKTIRLSEKVAEISVKSGFASYSYLLPAGSK